MDEARLKPTGERILPSPGRIPGTDSVYQPDFRVVASGATTLRLTASPPNPKGLAISSTPIIRGQ